MLRAALLALYFLTLAHAAEPNSAAWAGDGNLHLTTPAGELATFRTLVADSSWGIAQATPGEGTLQIKLGAGLTADTTSAPVKAATGNGTLATWRFTAQGPLQFNCLAVSADLPVNAFAGGTWQADTSTGTFPATLDQQQLFYGTITALHITAKDGRTLHITWPTPTDVVIQDNRTWKLDTFSLRIGKPQGTMADKEVYELPLTLSMPDGLRTVKSGPSVLAADDDWVALKQENDIVPGSALDLSGQGFTTGPCGAKGRVIATPDGHFAFADEPTKPQRFYGVNLCFGANYLSHAQSDQLLDRLVRLGYNCVRVHHYEFRLTAQDWQPGLEWSPEHLDQLDYLMAGCAKRGLWLTSDLYVSRWVAGAAVGLDGAKRDDYRALLPVHEPAYADWMAFSRKFLDRINPYTKRRVADEPALAWLSLVNEDEIANTWDQALALPQWQLAWNAWLAKRCADRTALATLLGDLAPDEDPVTNSVKLPRSIEGDAPRTRAAQVFTVALQRTMVARMRAFLHDELKCPALLTDLNGWNPHLTDQLARPYFDYVDDHFYIDHPQFLNNDWRPPSHIENANPVRLGAPGGGSSALLRVWGKPFTVSEFNYAAPGKYRAVGSILTGALAGLQDWDAVWRFAYSHSEQTLFQPSPLTYFDLASDPLNQAADRAALLLFLRRDLKPAPHRVALALTRNELEHPQSGPQMWHGPMWLAWLTRVGSAVVDDDTQVPNDAIQLPLGWAQPAPTGLAAFANNRTSVEALLRDKGIPVEANQLRSETGELTLEPATGTLRCDTPRTAGGYADAGQSITAANAGVHVTITTTGATVFVTSLDAQPIRNAKRLLITHLTDLQNTGARFSEETHQTLLSWGGLPHLMHDGAAQVQLTLTDPAAYTIYALSTSGRRLEKVATTATADSLSIPLRVRATEGARMLYEVVRE